MEGNDKNKKGVSASEQMRSTPFSSTSTAAGVSDPAALPAASGTSPSAALRNPLAEQSEDQMLTDLDSFLVEKELTPFRDNFVKGAYLSRLDGSPTEQSAFMATNLDQAEHEFVEAERDASKFTELRRQATSSLVMAAVLCCGCATTQGMDQTAVNGAQEFYFHQFKITNTWLHGLLNGAPYLAASLLGCWVSPFINKKFGRRGAIFACCILSTAASCLQAAAPRWEVLLVARFLLGIALGAKSSTASVYVAESAPKQIRGRLTMLWQVFTAFGIMLGFCTSLAFQNVKPQGPYSQWRLMLGITAVPPALVAILVFFCVESPRWLMERGRFNDAYASFCKLRRFDVLAARDMYYSHVLLQLEAREREGVNKFKEFFCKKRNARAAKSAGFVMLMQQLCGVNVIAYYSTAIFREYGFTLQQSLIVSLGCGIVNFLGAFPALLTIDSFGRRNLLLSTFPLLCIFLLFTGCSFQIPEAMEQARLACVATGIYLFMLAYSPGMGPVPYPYSAEAFPLYLRDFGMSYATSVCWFFNFMLSLTWPSMLTGMGATGAFGLYAACNAFGFVYTYFFLPETAGYTLEELDMVFSVPLRTHAKYYTSKIPYYAKKITRRDVAPFPPLLEKAGAQVDKA